MKLNESTGIETTAQTTIHTEHCKPEGNLQTADKVAAGGTPYGGIDNVRLLVQNDFLLCLGFS